LHKACAPLSLLVLQSESHATLEFQGTASFDNAAEVC
jgi:hypothetical protein